MMMFFLHLLPPEIAHRVTLLALKFGLGPRLKNTSDLRFLLFGKQLRNPIGLAAGADKKAAVLPGWSKMGFGLVEVGTITVHPRAGNPQPRMWRIKDQAVINWLGIPGDGLDSCVRNLAAYQRHPTRKDCCVGVSVASPEGVVEDFKIMAKTVAPYVDYIALNISCPNVAQKENASPEETSTQQILACKSGAGRVPVLVKLEPTRDKPELERMVKAALDAGADGFIATNTVSYANRHLLGDIHCDWPESPHLTASEHNKDGDRQPASLCERSLAASEHNKVGGYSGPRLLDVSCWMVRELRTLIPATMPIIGVGGIMSGKDAKTLLNSGANAVQLYTGLIYKGPPLLDDIAATLST